MIHYAVTQNSDDWDLLRLGKFTASTFSDLFMGRSTAGYQRAIIKVAFERVTGESEESFSNRWMVRGHEKEPFAREKYQIETFNMVEDAGFYEFNDWIGASPDAKIIDMNGGCEFKSPSFQVYNEYLETRKIPKSYYWQIHGQLYCTGWDFIDYMPYSSAKLKQVLIRVERDEKVLNELENQLNICIEEAKTLIERIKQ